MDLRWISRQSPDDRDVAWAVALAEAARAVDAPHRPCPTTRSLLGDLQHGWDGDGVELALAVDPAGGVTGLVSLELPRRDNTHMAMVEMVVDPCRRRRGLGRQVLATALDHVPSTGRSLAVLVTDGGPAGDALAKAFGFEVGIEDVERRLDLHVLDRGRLHGQLRAAAAVAEGYELVRVGGRTPDDLLDEVATLTGAINDAPVDDLDIEDEVFTPDRVRGFEAAQESRGRRVYRLLARERATGELAGLTVVSVDGEQPWHASQLDTSVARTHRGHRLGLLLKASMVEWLDEAEPQLRVVDTWNAASNTHMIRVNEELGCRPVARQVVWQRHL